MVSSSLRAYVVSDLGHLVEVTRYTEVLRAVDKAVLGGAEKVVFIRGEDRMVLAKVGEGYVRSNGGFPQELRRAVNMFAVAVATRHGVGPWR